MRLIQQTGALLASVIGRNQSSVFINLPHCFHFIRRRERNAARDHKVQLELKNAVRALSFAFHVTENDQNHFKNETSLEK